MMYPSECMYAWVRMSFTKVAYENVVFEINMGDRLS